MSDLQAKQRLQKLSERQKAKKKNSKNNHTERFCYYVKTHVRLSRMWYSGSRLIKLQFVLKLFKNTADGTVVRRDVDLKQHI